MRKLIKSKLLLMMFLVGAASGFFVSAAGWWGLQRSASDLERLHEASAPTLRHLSEVEKTLQRSQALFLDALRKQELTDADQSALDEGDRRLRQALVGLRAAPDFAQHWEEVGHLYERLSGSRAETLKLLESSPEHVYRFHTANTQPLFDQLLTALYRIVPPMLERSDAAYQEAQASNRAARTALLLLSLLASVFFCGIAWITYREAQTRRRQATQIDRDHALFRTLFESSNDGVIMWRDGAIRDMNRAARAMFTLPPEQRVSEVDLAALLPDDLAGSGAQAEGSQHGLQARVDAALRDGSDRCEWEAAALDGRRFPVELALDTARLPDGVVVQLTVRDISARRTSERSMRLANQAFESSLEGMVITDHQANILTVNAAFTTITGYSRDEVIGRNPRLLGSGRQTREFYDQMWHAIDTDGKWQGEIWNIRKDGDIYPQWLNVSRVTDEQGRLTNYVGVFSDISERKSAEERILRQVYYDQLTDLPNRVLFSDRLTQVMSMAKRHPDAHFAVMFVDLDRFKLINDSLGHDAGDQLLQQAAHRLRGCMRESDTVARMAGDEFTVILTEITDARDAATVARKIVDNFREPFQLNQQDIYVSASIGVSVYPEDGVNADLLLKNADMAMYRAKAAGGAWYELYDEELDKLANHRLEMETALHKALERGEFELHYQPQFDNDSGRLLGFEALLRWRHPEHGLLQPDAFLAIAEETGLILPIGAWVLRTACAQAEAWRRHYPGHRTIAVNLSTRQFQSEELAQQIQQALLSSDLPPFCLQLEVSEHTLMQNAEAGQAVMLPLAEQGVQFTLDHFGVGHCSLALLKRLPVQALKIDQSFVRNVDRDTRDAAVVGAIVAMADKPGLRVVAQGIEERDQLNALQAYKGLIAQGYLLGRPLPATAATDIVAGKEPVVPA